jgi:predicted DsbA family dithiol-disulfide isomerase
MARHEPAAAADAAHRHPAPGRADHDAAAPLGPPLDDGPAGGFSAGCRYRQGMSGAAPGAATSAITLDVFSDVVCPWCWLGHARLRTALAEEPPGSVEVRWHAFQLDPSVPPEGAGYAEHFASRFPPEAMRAGHERLRELGAAEGLEYHFERITRAANTILAHRAIKVAGVVGAEAEAVSALFEAYFRDGRDIGDLDTVVDVVSAGADVKPDALRAALEAGAGIPEVEADLELARRLRIEGVPYFLAAGRVAVSGAHEPEVLRQLIASGRERAAAEPQRQD